MAMKLYCPMPIFPAHSLHSKVIRADGITVSTLLKGIAPLFEFDAYVDAPLIMMQVVPLVILSIHK